MPAGCRLRGSDARTHEDTIDLVIEIDTVRDQDDPWVARRTRLEDRLGEHNHRQRLTAALSMPHHTTRARPIWANSPEPFQNVPDGKVLLVACHLAGASFEHGVPAREFQQPQGLTECVQKAVLLRHRTPGRNLLCPPCS